jgi:uncharacterized RDD family membrane protein YckC
MGPAIHAWDCLCGARNAPQLTTCHRCGGPIGRGTAVRPSPAVAPSQVASPPAAAPLSPQIARPPAYPPAPQLPPAPPPTYPLPPAYSQPVVPAYGLQAPYGQPPYGYPGYAPEGWSIPRSMQYERGDAMGRRIGAYLIDSAVLSALIWGGLILGAILFASPLAALGLVIAVMAYASPLFNWLLLGYLYGRGQTIGMYALGLRTVDANGNPPGLGRGIIRTLSMMVSPFLLFIPHLAMFWDPDQQTWHDRWSGIWVVRA